VADWPTIDDGQLNLRRHPEAQIAPICTATDSTLMNVGPAVTGWPTTDCRTGIAVDAVESFGRGP